jgi:hypothetical protein
MDEVLAKLATSGAQTIVTLMTTDLWHGLRDRVVNIFRRGDNRQQEAVAAELESSRDHILTSTQEKRQEIETYEQDLWEARLRIGLIEQPEIADLINSLLNEARAMGVTSSNDSHNISLKAHAHDNARIYQQGYGVQRNS